MIGAPSRILNKDVFKIDDDFSLNEHHKIVLICGTCLSGKTSFLINIENFYLDLGFVTINYDFHPHDLTILNRIQTSNLHNNKIVIFCDEMDVNNAAKMQNCLTLSRLKNVHRIFITTHVRKDVRINGSYKVSLPARDVYHMSDLILLLQRTETKNIIIKVLKNRACTTIDRSLRNFFYRMAHSYFYKYHNKHNIDVAKLRKYFRVDFSILEVQNFKALFSYY